MTAPPGPNSRILAADIGGTHSRFAAVDTDGSHHARSGPVFEMETRHPDVCSLADFWQMFERNAPAELASASGFDAVALALAGMVDGHSAVLPNIDWDIRAGETDRLPIDQPLFLVNDFAAQGWALSLDRALDRLVPVRRGATPCSGSIAVVGAGTGLGHCALHPIPQDLPDSPRFLVAGSEAGHATFAFQGEDEQALQRQWLTLDASTDGPGLTNDDVVSGRGAAMLHRCLTGATVTPAEALSGNHPHTVRWFNRFFGRACRNYCLSVFPVCCLVISGGIAARNPRLVHSVEFQQSFDAAREYAHLFHRIPILLNTDQHIGITGAAVYAARQLRHAGADPTRHRPTRAWA